MQRYVSGVRVCESVPRLDQSNEFTAELNRFRDVHVRRLFVTSDRRRKTDVTPVKPADALACLRRVQCYHYRIDGSAAVGHLAEEIPGEYLLGDGGAVDYQSMAALLWTAVRDLDARVHQRKKKKHARHRVPVLCDVPPPGDSDTGEVHTRDVSLTPRCGGTETPRSESRCDSSTRRGSGSWRRTAGVSRGLSAVRKQPSGPVSRRTVTRTARSTVAGRRDADAAVRTSWLPDPDALVVASDEALGGVELQDGHQVGHPEAVLPQLVTTAVQ